MVQSYKKFVSQGINRGVAIDKVHHATLFLAHIFLLLQLKDLYPDCITLHNSVDPKGLLKKWKQVLQAFIHKSTMHSQIHRL